MFDRIQKAVYKRRALKKGASFPTIVNFRALSERMGANPERAALLLSKYRGDILAGAVFLRAGPRFIISTGRPPRKGPARAKGDTRGGRVWCAVY